MDEIILTLFRIINSLNKKCQEIKIAQKKGVQVSNDTDTESVIDTDTAGRGIAGIDYRVLSIAHHYTSLDTW